jgi:hydroxyacylglutathione hydrolase
MRGMLIAFLLTLTGCASSASTFQGAGLTVHTIREAYANAHLIVKDGRAVLVDSGVAEKAPVLEKAIAEHIDPAKLGAIVITHGHYDHAGGASYFKSKFGTKLIAGRGDAELFASGKMDPLCPVGALAKSRHAEDQAGTYPPVTPDVWVEGEMDLAPYAGFPAKAVLLPGHTKGSLIVVLDEIVAVGDLFRGGLASSEATTHFYMCDVDDNRRDVKLLLGTIAPRATHFFTGHFGPVDRSAVQAFVE